MSEIPAYCQIAIIEMAKLNKQVLEHYSEVHIQGFIFRGSYSEVHIQGFLFVNFYPSILLLTHVAMLFLSL